MPRTAKGLRFHPACELINEPVLVAWAPLRTGDSWVRKESHLSLTATTIATLSSSPGPSVPTGQREGGQVTPALTACGTESEWRSAGLRDPGCLRTQRACLPVAAQGDAVSVSQGCLPHRRPQKQSSTEVRAAQLQKPKSQWTVISREICVFIVNC